MKIIRILAFLSLLMLVCHYFVYKYTKISFRKMSPPKKGVSKNKTVKPSRLFEKKEPDKNENDSGFLKTDNTRSMDTFTLKQYSGAKSKENIILDRLEITEELGNISFQETMKKYNKSATEIQCTNKVEISPQYLNNFWQILQIPPSKSRQSGVSFHRSVNYFHLWRAYYDIRPASEISNPKVRILTVQVPVTTLTVLPFCVFWFKNNTTANVKISKDDIRTIRNPARVGSKDVLQTVVSCNCNYPKDILPTHVSLSFSCGEILNKLEIFYPDDKQKKHRFGICAPILYDNIPSKEAVALVEWLEYYYLMGVRGMHFYGVVLDMHPSVKTVMDYYASIGMVTFTEMQPQVESYKTTSGFVIKMSLLLLGLTDCFLANYARYEHVLIVDLDDIAILQNRKGNFEENIQKYPDKSTSYSMHSINYFLDFEPQQYFNDQLITSKYTRTTGYGTIGRKSKYKPILNTATCLSPWQHGCQLHVEGVKSHARGLSANLITVHHYRRSCAQGYRSIINGTKQADRGRATACSIYNQETKNDKSALIYRPYLLERVKAIINKLNLDPHNSY